MAHKPIEVAVLNTIQALGADAVLSAGKFNINDGTNDLTTPVKVIDGVSFTKTAYAAGTASVKEYDFAAISLLPNSQYVISVRIESQANVAGNVTTEADDLITIREYVVWTGTSIPTADDIKNAFISRINADPNADVTAASGGVGILELKLKDVADGDFTVLAPAGTVETVTTAYVAPAGTPDIVNADKPNAASPTGQYTTYDLVVRSYKRHNGVSGGKVVFEETIRIYADSSATNYASFDTAITDIMSGAHTPVSDYLGV